MTETKRTVADALADQAEAGAAAPSDPGAPQPETPPAPTAARSGSASAAAPAENQADAAPEPQRKHDQQKGQDKRDQPGPIQPNWIQVHDHDGAKPTKQHEQRRGESRSRRIRH